MARTAVVRPGQGEVIVETGAGIVIKLEQTTGARNMRVEFRATHANLNDPVAGWLDTANEAAAELVRAAHADQRVLEYRIEVHRKDGVDLDRPIKDLGNREKVRDLIAVGYPGTLSGPPTENRPPQPAPAPAPATNGGAAPQTPPGPPASAQAPTESRRKVAEARPWEPLNSDGSPNLGSYAVQAAAGMVDLAVELLVAGARGLYPKVIESVAVDLIAAADGIQAGATGQRADRMDNSHPRARGILRTVLKARPYPLDEVVAADGATILDTAAKAVGPWHDKVTKAGAGLFTIAVRVSGVDWREA